MQGVRSCETGEVTASHRKRDLKRVAREEERSCTGITWSLRAAR
jgi:hypothetical protein